MPPWSRPAIRGRADEGARLISIYLLIIDPVTRTRLPAFGISVMLHLLILAGLGGWPSASGRPRATPQTRDRIAVFVVPREDPAMPGLNPRDEKTADASIRRPGRGSSTLSLPGFAFDVAKIADRAPLLFPFLTPGLSLAHFGLAPREERGRLLNPLARASRGHFEGPPLALSDAALQQLIDTAWSRRDRWKPFQRIVQLATSHSPDAGRLPAVIQAYLRQDGLQPYVDTDIRDPRLWTELGLAADHVQFIGFIRQYASDHPSTRTTTELLFLLDELVQGSLDALVTLVDTDPAENLGWTRHANSDAYNLIVDVRRYYRAELARRGLVSAGALRAHYDKVRLAILTGLLRTTPQGYRASDARFLIGAINWKQGQMADALRAWREMAIDPTDGHVIAYSEILAAISDSSGPAPGPGGALIDRALSTEINRILHADRARWVMFSFDRLRQFGYRFDTF